jgi:hypothetical protein
MKMPQGLLYYTDLILETYKGLRYAESLYYVFAKIPELSQIDCSDDWDIFLAKESHLFCFILNIYRQRTRRL